MKACTSLGIVPSELYIITFKEYLEQNPDVRVIDSELQHFRYDENEKLRTEAIESVKKRRQEIMQESKQNKNNSKKKEKKEDDAEREYKKLMKKEKKDLEKIKKRQKMEIQKIIERRTSCFYQ